MTLQEIGVLAGLITGIVGAFKFAEVIYGRKAGGNGHAKVLQALSEHREHTEPTIASIAGVLRQRDGDGALLIFRDTRGEREQTEMLREIRDALLQLVALQQRPRSL